ncbi:MAG: ATP-dependent RecD-like DNA helicase [Eubacterium sp.]|nr:ATP-dependent RecD-like DNA helicase [Eubacterium sp.]
MTREGYIEKIIYKNEDNGYAVFVVETNDGEEIFVGTLGNVAEGMYIQAEGEFVHHPQYDIQFKFSSYNISMPEDTKGIEKYLGSGIIKGIGEVLAKRIVKKFKLDTLRIIEEEPERLAEVKGISLDKANKIAVSYSESHEFQEVIIFLSKYGINAKLAIKIYEEYGKEVYNVIRDNPYRLAEDVAGVGFKKADEIAMAAGIAEDSSFRIHSATLYALNNSMQEGHMYLPERLLASEVYSLIGSSEEEQVFLEKFHDLLIDMAMNKKVVLKSEEENGQEYTIVYSFWNYNTEIASARKLMDLKLRFEIPEEEINSVIKEVETDCGFCLDEIQKCAVREAISSGVAVITGGPGTGKTTIINAIIKYFNNNAMEVLLAAPTGRAAKRMTESTGKKAETIHRLLEFSGEPQDDTAGRRLTFNRNEDNPLEADVIIIDEASMLDATLFLALLKAINYGTRLILVGDIDQLPSVGAGNVLHDIILSGCFPVTTLTSIFRQSKESSIVSNAHMIKNGIHLTISNKSKDFFFIPRKNSAEILKEVNDLLIDNLPKYLKIPAKEIQVLTPMRRYELGVESLNKRLQSALNPKTKGVNEKDKGDVIFREGDKVMQIKNNYKIEWRIPPCEDNNYVMEEGVGVFNGDMGYIASIDDFNEEVLIHFDDGREAVYTYNMLDEVEHAFAITIHKSQGSEYPAVIIPLLAGPEKLFNRNLLYTAVTRAKQMVVIVGNINLVNRMIDNISEQRRFTTFAKRIKEMDEI